MTSCDIEPFRYQAAPQPDLESGASANQINEQSLEDYLNRLREAVCTDIQGILDQIDEILANCCDGGGGASTFLELTDTPSAYTGEGSKVVSVKADESGLEFTTPAAGADSDGLVLDYSTSEQTCTRTFLAGATIYQKTINFGALPAAGNKSVAHGITGLTDVIAHQAWTRDPASGSRLPIPFASPTAANNIQLNVNATNVVITVGINRSSFTSTYVTLWYLK